MVQRRILIIDDDIDDQELFAEAISELNGEFGCECASNGEEGLELLNDKNRPLPDLIFLDLNMPRLNGKQCLERIKASPRLKNIPVIIYSTSSQENDIRDTMAMGAIHFLTKPSSFNELCNSLGDVLVRQNFPVQTS